MAETLSPKSRQTGVIQVLTKQKLDKSPAVVSTSPKALLSPRIGKQKAE